MIIKSFELNKLNLNNYNYFLFWNQRGSKLERVVSIKSKNIDRKVYKYEKRGAG